MQLLTFTVGGGDFGVPLKDIELVEGRSNEIVELPAASAHIRGLVTIRGDIVPVYSLASRFGYHAEELRYFVIVNVEGMKLGLEVDRVNSVIEPEEAEVLSVPLFLGGRGSCLKNIISSKQRRLIVLIDVNELMPQNERAEIDQMIADK